MCKPHGKERQKKQERKAEKEHTKNRPRVVRGRGDEILA